MTLCLGYYKDKRSKEFKERSLHYIIAKSFAVKLPKIQEFWPIDGEVIDKPKPLSKKQAQKVKDFHNYLMSYGWRKKQNG